MPERFQGNPKDLYRVGDALLDPAARRLTRADQDIHLSPKAFDLLVLLITRAPAVVDKGEIRNTVWAGVHVVDANISNLITEIRGAIKPAALIRTVHGVGYAFTGDLDRQTWARPAFRTAAPSALFVVVNGRPVALQCGENIIGRDAKSHVWVDVDGVSRRHACVRVSDDGTDATIEDLKSTNGTYVAGRKVTTPAPLHDGDQIDVGPGTIVFRTERSASTKTRRVKRPSRDLR